MFMKRLTILAIAVLMMAASSINAQTKWSVDKAHSSVKFSVVHMIVSEVEGNFKMFDGSLEAAKADFSDAKINFTIDANSINTDNERREGHLKSADFFDVAVYPSIKFVSTSMKPLGGNKYELNGNLTLKDVTKPVVFQVTYGGTLVTKNGAKAGFKAKTTIDRYDYNLKWNNALEAGGLAVSKEVEITVNVELNKN
jgi:polyisoprenoid-binding protein YceI